MGSKASIVYNLKSTTSTLNAHISKYPPELLQYVQNELAEMIYYFGYAKVGEDNETGFFEYEENRPEDLAQYYGFKNDSQRCLEEVSAEGYVPSQFFPLGISKTIDFMPPHMMVNVSTPALIHAQKRLEAATSKK